MAIVDLDRDTKQYLDARLQSELQSSPVFDEAVAKGQIQKFEPTKFNLGTGPFSTALQKRINEGYGEDVRRIQQLQKLGFSGENLARLQKSTAIENEHMRFKMARIKAMQDRKRAEEAQRAQLLSNVLGMVGMGVGMYFGGPMGAAAGSQVGQNLGQTTTSNMNRE